MKPVLLATASLAAVLAISLSGCAPEATDSAAAASDCGAAWKAVADKRLEAQAKEHETVMLLEQALEQDAAGDLAAGTDFVHQATDSEAEVRDLTDAGGALIDAMPTECR